jgi:hypothetical protein
LFGKIHGEAIARIKSATTTKNGHQSRFIVFSYLRDRKNSWIQVIFTERIKICLFVKLVDLQPVKTPIFKA